MQTDTGSVRPAQTLVVEPRPAHAAPPPAAPSLLVLSPGLVWRVGLGLVVGQALLRLLMGLGSYFTQDDFVFYTLAASQKFDLAYLFQERGNHLMPAGQAIVWPLAQYVPLEHGPAVLVMVVLQLAASLAVLGLLRELFGLRTGILAPLSFYLFGALTLPAFLWWAASLNAIGLQLGMALALRCHVRWLRRRHWVAVVGTGASTLLALSFFEKGILLLPLLVGMTWVIDRRRGPLRDLWAALAHNWGVWVLLVIITGAWSALYLTQVNSSYAAPPTTGVAADLVVDSVGQGVVPAVFSGPWVWTELSSVLGSVPASPTWLILASWVGLIVVFGLTVAIRRGAGRMWLVAAGYLAGDLGLVVWGRAGAFGPGVGLEFRYYADAALVFALLVGYCILPLRGEEAPWAPRSRGFLTLIKGHAEAVRAAAWLALILWCVGATWSSIGLAEHWRANPARDYIENVRDELAGLPPETPLLDEPVPQSVLMGWFIPYNGTSYVLAPLHDRPAFVPSVTDLLTVTPEGHVVPGTVDGIRSRPGPRPGCGWAVGATTTRIPLDRSVFLWNWTVKVAYLAGADTTATFTLGKTTVDVPLKRGLHDVYFALADTGSIVEVTLKTPGVGVCIDRIDVGNRQQAPDPTAEGLTPPAPS